MFNYILESIKLYNIRVEYTAFSTVSKYDLKESIKLSVGININNKQLIDVCGNILLTSLSKKVFIPQCFVLLD